MAHNTTLNLGTGGDTVVDVDLSLATYPTGTGKLPAGCIYVSVDATTAPTPVTAANAFYVQPGTGATWAATQSGAWNITNITGTITLPTGAATAAKQPALGVAGTASADVITVQGIAGMTAVKVDGSGVTQPVSGTVTANLAAGTNVIGHVIVDSGTITTVSTLTSITNVVHVDDNSASLTVDAPVATPVFVRLSDGTNPIATLPVSLASVPSHDVTNAGTFAVQAAGVTGAIYSGTTSLTPKFKAISCSTSGDNTLVAGVTSKKIRVLSIGLYIVGTAISIYFRDNTAGTAIWADGTNPIPLDKTGAAGAGGFILGYNPLGWFESSVGNPLVVNLSGAQAVAGGLTYCEV